MGYNKNVTPYVLKALAAQKANPGSDIEFIHNNAYKTDELGECFERNAEGMLKNMAIHELALLATYFGVTVDNIASVAPDAECAAPAPSHQPDVVAGRRGLQPRRRSCSVLQPAQERGGSGRGAAGERRVFSGLMMG